MSRDAHTANKGGKNLLFGPQINSQKFYDCTSIYILNKFTKRFHYKHKHDQWLHKPKHHYKSPEAELD